MRFRVLGPLEALDGAGRPVRLGAPKQRVLLGMLLLHADRPVPVDRLVDALWPDGPPRSARQVLRTYASALRAALSLDGLSAQPAGYRLVVPPDELDLTVFERLADEGERALAGGDLPLAAERLPRARVAEELGIGPGPELRRGPGDVLAAQAPGAGSAAPPAVPRQLPAVARHCTGRTTELAELTELLGHTDTVVITAIDGMAGIGKTTTVVHWAHRVADRFPDGQLYVNLRGFDASGSVMAPEEALRSLLDALGVPTDLAPAGLDVLAARYRSQLAGRRVLVVLDNARDTAQVRPLLPGSPGCFVVVTSRRRLADLVAGEGARLLTLDLLTPDEARKVLANRIGAGRVAVEPDAVDEIIARCGRLPLALAVTAARAAVRPAYPLSVLAGELRDAPDGLAGDLRAVFSWSYRQLSAPAARLFRLLGLHPGPQAGTPVVASLAGLPPSALRPALAELTSAHLLAGPVPGPYALHDLLRAYATELAATDPERPAARHRMLEHYLHTACAGVARVDPHAYPTPLPPPDAGVAPEEIRDGEHALAWFTAERPALLAAVRLAAQAGLAEPAWRLGGAASALLSLEGAWAELAAVGYLALDAAARLDDREAQSRTHRKVTVALIRLGRFDDAEKQLRCALDIAPDPRAEALVHHWMAVLLEARGEYARALTHVQRSGELFTRLGDRIGAVRAQAMAGWLHTNLGEYEVALGQCQEALAQMRALGDEFVQAAALDTIGHAYRHLGEYALAVEYCTQAAEQCGAIGDRHTRAQSLVSLGEVLAETGDPAGARTTWQQALELHEVLGYDTADIHTRLAGLTATAG